jgi:hypothetical protein
MHPSPAVPCKGDGGGRRTLSPATKSSADAPTHRRRGQPVILLQVARLSTFLQRETQDGVAVKESGVRESDCKREEGVRLARLIRPPPPGAAATVSADWRTAGDVYSASVLSEEGVRLAETMHVGPCIPVGRQLEKAEVGPTSGPTFSHSSHGRESYFLPSCIFHYCSPMYKTNLGCEKWLPQEWLCRPRLARPAICGVDQPQPRVARRRQPHPNLHEGRAVILPPSEKDAKCAQKLGQLQPFGAVFPRMGQLTSLCFWANLTPFSLHPILYGESLREQKVTARKDRTRVWPSSRKEWQPMAV